MGTSSFSASRTAEELAETFRNGNRKDAVAALDALPKKRALAVCAYLVHYLTEPDDHHAVSVLLRLLSDRLS